MQFIYQFLQLFRIPSSESESELFAFRVGSEIVDQQSGGV
jgi:hypothetical protein